MTNTLNILGTCRDCKQAYCQLFPKNPTYLQFPERYSCSKWKSNGKPPTLDEILGLT